MRSGKACVIGTLIFLGMPAAMPAMSAARTDPWTPDRIASYQPVTVQADYVRREAMIPMRDGTRLFTVIIFRKGVVRGPILLTRTPYGAGKASWRNSSQMIEEILPLADTAFVNDGFIRVYQDVRGQGKSEGDYVMNRPLRGPLNPTAVDHATDAYDTIEWLIRNVPESNGKVGITGTSYGGFTTLMALVDPHPALKAAVPQNPMVDGWLGDDWFHNGAFRQWSFNYIVKQTAREGGGAVAYGTGDDYAAFLAAGSAGAFAKAYGLEAFPFIRKLMEHPSYDEFWSEQAVDKQLAKRKLSVPTLLVSSQWDQEDSYGAIAVYKALERQDIDNDKLFLVIGPWKHGGSGTEGQTLGPLKFGSDTSLDFRVRTMKPFFDNYLKDGGAPATIAPVLSYATGVNRWEESDRWPRGAMKPLYLHQGLALGFEMPKISGRDAYRADPAKPVPFVPRPVQIRDEKVWTSWLAVDQRFVADRPDVLVYTTPPLEKPVHIAGSPLADLFAATTGTDGDWVIKLIDVYPEEMSQDPQLAGYQLPVGIEIFRGRYVDGFATPRALKPGMFERYRFELPSANHVFRPGHRIMVQIQSSLFPLYDRNPQTFVPNIFEAKPQDYRAATQTIRFGPSAPSAIWLPIVAD